MKRSAADPGADIRIIRAAFEHLVIALRIDTAILQKLEEFTFALIAFSLALCTHIFPL